LETSAQKGSLDEHGQRLVDDTKEVLSATSTLVDKKLNEERFRRLVQFTQGAVKDEGLASAVTELMHQASGLGGQVSNKATDLTEYIKETTLNLTTSSQYRELALEFLRVLQNLMEQVHEGDDEEARTEDQILEQIRDKAKKFVKRVSEDEENRSLFRNFFQFSEQMYDSLYRATQEAKEKRQQKASSDLGKILDESWGILGDFVGEDMVSKFRENGNKFLSELDSDDKLRGWMKECKNLCLEIMDNPEMAQKSDDKIDELTRQGRDLTEKYRNDLNGLYDDANKILMKIRDDPVVKNFQEQLMKLGRDLALNSKGQPDLFVIERSMSQIRNLLVQIFRDVLVDVPIQRLQVNSDSFDLVLSDSFVRGTGLIPKTLHANLLTFSKIHFQETNAQWETTFRVDLRINQVKPEFHGVRFQYDKKSFPSFKDHGVADIIFGGDGLNAAAGITFYVGAGRLTRCVVSNCNVEVDKITLNIDKDKTKHDIIDFLLAPIYERVMTRKLQSSLEDFLSSRLREICSQLNSWFDSHPAE